MNGPIRVLQVVTITNRGGLESRLMDIYRNINRDKIQFDFLKHRKKEGHYDKEIKELGGMIYELDPITPLNLITKYPREWDLFFTNHKYKIVHCHLDALSTFLLKSAKKNKIPIRIAHSRIANHTNGLKGLLQEISKIPVKKYTTHNFACSKAAGKWLFGEKALKENKVTIINNAIQTEKFVFDSQIRQKIRNDLNISNKFVLGHVGRFDYQKNHDFLIEIINKLHKKNPNIILLLIGEGKLEKAIKEKVKKYNLEEYVKFLGVREDVPDLLQAMDLFLLPSHYEGLPGVAVESQAAGLITLLSDQITPETKITNLVEFLSIKNGVDPWVDRILYYSKGYERSNQRQALIDAGYDARQVAKWLENFYINEFKRITRS